MLQKSSQVAKVLSGSANNLFSSSVILTIRAAKVASTKWSSDVVQPSTMSAVVLKDAYNLKEMGELFLG